VPPLPMPRRDLRPLRLEKLLPNLAQTTQLLGRRYLQSGEGGLLDLA